MRTVFAGGRVFDGTGAAVADADVAVVDGQIAEVGVGLDGDEQIDVAGSTLLPGLFDTHVHVMFGHVDIWRHLQTPFSYRFYDAIRNLDATLRIGITTVRDAGGADLGVKQAVEEGIVRGPRLQISITMLSQTGGHGDGWMPSGATGELFPEYPGMPTLDRRRGRRGAAQGPRARPRRRRRDQDRDLRRRPLAARLTRPAGFLARGDRGDGQRGSRGRPLGDVARAVDRGHQERGPRRRPLDRARHLPRRRGDRAHARARRVPRSDARRAARRDPRRGGGCAHPGERAPEGGARSSRRTRTPSGAPPRPASRWRWVPMPGSSRTARTSRSSS